ncbi:hypothetical protein EXIGLDRAFT_832221 [Exidia glandulosa HHB12029]|uniref:CFEM domain-containing protein n=1 Tax=Exidia glandulosa HHB12029 TaxID=1314781 RepID=A0A165LSU5_EXIGL|nr:hypothetical protein EXIGLDRAFT_832221 [Exidia glandulosa HHB12029]
MHFHRVLVASSLAVAFALAQTDNVTSIETKFANCVLPCTQPVESQLPKVSNCTEGDDIVQCVCSSSALNDTLSTCLRSTCPDEAQLILNTLKNTCTIATGDPVDRKDQAGGALSALFISSAAYALGLGSVFGVVLLHL